jgi:cobalamin biosynthesis protein CobT
VCETPFLGVHTHKTACPVAYGLDKNELCHTFDFAAAARKIGMLMTVEGTNDDLICTDGVEKYTFTDADAGDLPVNERSDDEEEEQEQEKQEEQEEQEEQEDDEEQGRAGGGGSLDNSDNDAQEGEEALTHTFDDDSVSVGWSPACVASPRRDYPHTPVSPPGTSHTRRGPSHTEDRPAEPCVAGLFVVSARTNKRHHHHHH